MFLERIKQDLKEAHHDGETPPTREAEAASLQVAQVMESLVDAASPPVPEYAAFVDDGGEVELGLQTCGDIDRRLDIVVSPDGRTATVYAIDEDNMTVTETWDLPADEKVEERARWLLGRT